MHRSHLATLRRRRDFLRGRLDAGGSSSPDRDRGEVAALTFAIRTIEAHYPDRAPR